LVLHKRRHRESAVNSVKEEGLGQDQGIEEFVAAPNIQTLEAKLTLAMAQQRIQAIIKDGNLSVICEAISRLATAAGKDGWLLGAAALARLAAVARGREQQAWAFLPRILVEEPPPIDTLQSGDVKAYAAQSLRHVSTQWVTSYCIAQALAIESADIARRELLSVALDNLGNISALLAAVIQQGFVLKALETQEARARRARRIAGALSEAISAWDGDVGDAPGTELGKLITLFLKASGSQLDDSKPLDLLDKVFSILTRAIEMRFSLALRGETYAALQQAKGLLGTAAWGEFTRASHVARRIKVDLLEAALVLARQNRTDKEIQQALVAACGSRTEMLVAIRNHFGAAPDLDLATRDWWLGRDATQGADRQLMQKIGNTEDQQIGNILVEVESSKEAMEKVKRAVIPLLEISDPVLAATLKKASSSYVEIAQGIRRLARMRKLSLMGVGGEKMEYNLLEHDMVGGHKAGIRWVRVVRDGVRKDFAGTAKTLVKPWVEADGMGGS
jgi:hypothetical protein